MQPGQQSSFTFSAAESKDGEVTCTCPVGHFWYVSHVYEEEIKRIEKENGVKFEAEVKITFHPHQKDGDPHKALSEFTGLVQNSLAESNGSVFPLKYIDPEDSGDILKIIQKNENKLLLTLSSEGMTVCGPSQSQDAITKSLNISQKTLTDTSTSVGESTWAFHDASLTIGMSVKDPLADAGLTMEQSSWRLMTTSYNEQVAKIKTKFDVDLRESGISEGKVDVKACYKRSGGNVSMESHAVRALLRLYQWITTSPLKFTQHHGASGFFDSPKNLSNDYPLEGASSGPVSNGESRYGMHNAEAPTGWAATVGDSKDEDCPICMDTFINKKQLKCKHEFCEECLEQAKRASGPICPVCKDVFGIIEGDQPGGKMLVTTQSSSLPGFPDCGTIVITYHIPGGIQKVNALI